MKALWFSLMLLFPCAIIAQTPAQTLQITVTGGALGNPVLDAKVAVILKSGAYQMAKLEGDKYVCEIPGPCIKVFTGAPGHEAKVTKVSGGTGTLAVNLTPSTTKSSVVIERIAPLPGIDGHVNPQLDQHNRTYIHTKKIGLLKNGRPAAQPLTFTLKQSIDAETPTGQKFTIWVADITQQVSLLEYTMPE